MRDGRWGTPPERSVVDYLARALHAVTDLPAVGELSAGHPGWENERGGVGMVPSTPIAFSPERLPPILKPPMANRKQPRGRAGLDGRPPGGMR